MRLQIAAPGAPLARRRRPAQIAAANHGVSLVIAMLIGAIVGLLAKLRGSPTAPPGAS